MKRSRHQAARHGLHRWTKTSNSKEEEDEPNITNPLLVVMLIHQIQDQELQIQKEKKGSTIHWITQSDGMGMSLHLRQIVFLIPSVTVFYKHTEEGMRATQKKEWKRHRRRNKSDTWGHVIEVSRKNNRKDLFIYLAKQAQEQRVLSHLSSERRRPTTKWF